MFYIALYFGTYSTIFSDFLHPNCNNKNMYILEIIFDWLFYLSPNYKCKYLVSAWNRKDGTWFSKIIRVKPLLHTDRSSFFMFRLSACFHNLWPWTPRSRSSSTKLSALSLLSLLTSLSSLCQFLIFLFCFCESACFHNHGLGLATQAPFFPTVRERRTRKCFDSSTL